MSSLSNPFNEMSPLEVTEKPNIQKSIGLFGPAVRISWIVVAFLTIAPELLPVTPMHRAGFVVYYLVKVISFLMLGFLAPLAFRSLNEIGLGMLLSFLSAFVIESCQGLLHNGHVFHWYELAGKLSLIALGFAVALDCRYEKKITLGRLQLKLAEPPGL